DCAARCSAESWRRRSSASRPRRFPIQPASGFRQVFKEITEHTERKIENGSSNSPYPWRRKEAALLPHRRRRQPCTSRRPLHREARQLQPAAGEGFARAREARRRPHLALAERRRAAVGPRAALPRRGGPPRAAGALEPEEGG